jgi:hypothetical protein
MAFATVEITETDQFATVAEKTPAIPETSGEIPHAWANILTYSSGSGLLISSTCCTFSG